MKTIALANQKGGVGKTTTAASLGVGLSRQGTRNRTLWANISQKQWQATITWKSSSCSPNAGGRAVYFRELYSGEECRWNIGDVLGIVDTEKLPEWAKQKVAEHEEARAAKEKERGEAR